MGGIMQKVMGPLMTAAGIGAAFIPGGQAFAAPLITSGIGSTMGPGGLLGAGAPNIPAPSHQPNISAASFGPPATPDIPQSAATGISTFTPGAGPSSGAGAGPVGADMSAYSNMIASNMMTNNPFAIYGGGQ